jgi:superfamily II DNA or RNA helicase
MAENQGGNMQIKVGNNIRIKDATSETKTFIKSALIIDNPTFYNNERLGYKNYGIPRQLQFFTKDGSDFIVPFGCLSNLWKIHPFKSDYEFKIRKFNFIHFVSKISLYDYQKQALETILKAKNGILVMPAGAGKTQTAIEAIARIGGKTLWITHTIDLLNQSKSSAERNLINLKPDCIGVIGNGKINIGSHITFATVQTLNNLDLEQYRDTWDVVIVDECHRICGTPASAGMFYKVIDKISARYKIGLTATPYRSAKGTEIAMFGLLGETIIEIDKSVVKTIKARVQRIDTDWVINDDCLKSDGTMDYIKMTNEMVRDYDRNCLIVEKLKENTKGYCLVLSDRVKHLQFLRQHLGQGLVIDGSMVSRDEKGQRQDALQLMRDCKEHFLFATYQLAKEGLDIPNLDRLFMVTPHKDPITIIQSIGRIEREYPEKKTPICFDFVDSTGYHVNQWKSRKTIYKKNDNVIIDVLPTKQGYLGVSQLRIIAQSLK